MTPRLPRSAPALVGALALLAAPGCSSGSNTAELILNTEAEAPPGVTLAAATWTRATDPTGITPEPEGGWSVETDLGYRVRVVDGWLSHHSVSLAPCDITAQTAEDARSIGLPLASAPAHAEDQDPSAIEALLAEDLTRLGDAELGASSFPPARYCQTHWLVARATGEQLAPEGIAMESSSLRVSGTWSRAGITMPFAIDTWWPQAILADIAAPDDELATAGADGKTHFAFITIRRALGRAFDGIPFETATDDQVAGTLLNSLVAGADVTVELWSPSSP